MYKINNSQGIQFNDNIDITGGGTAIYIGDNYVTNDGLSLQLWSEKDIKVVIGGTVVQYNFKSNGTLELEDPGSNRKFFIEPEGANLNQIKSRGATWSGQLIFDNDTLTLSRSWLLPDASGTIALTSDLTSSISGATGQVPYFDSANSITGSTDFTFDSGTLTLSVPNLIVGGTTTTVNSTVVAIEDPIFVIGGTAPQAADDNKDRGIQFNYHNGVTSKYGFFGFDDTDSRFKFIPDATNTSEIITGSVGDAEFSNIYFEDSTSSIGASGDTVTIRDSKEVLFDISGAILSWNGGNLVGTKSTQGQFEINTQGQIIWNKGTTGGSQVITFPDNYSAYTWNLPANSGTLALTTDVPDIAIGGTVTGASQGSIFFGGTGGNLQQDNANLFWDDANNRLGIGTNTPAEILEVVQNTERFKLNLDFGDGPQAALSTTQTDLVSRFAVSDGVVATTMNSIGFGWTGSTVYGDPGDSSIYSNTSANGISIISAPGTGTEDYIRFYAGGNPQTSTSDLFIGGTGAYAGNVGIGTETPTDILEVVQNTEKFTLDLDNSNGPLAIVSSTNNTKLIRSLVSDGSNQLQIGIVGTGSTAYSAYGATSDSFVYSSASSNGLNIISSNGSGTQDYIRMYAGKNASSTADLFIGGTGAYDGFVGMGTETPEANLNVVGSSAGGVVFKVDGTAGELFTITDSLTGVLFSVTNSSATPIFEVEDTNEVRMGDNTAPAGFTTAKLEVTGATGANGVHNIDMTTYDMATFDYVAIGGTTNYRAGTIQAVWDGTTYQYYETTTADIGDTTPVTFDFAVGATVYGATATDITLVATVTTTPWTIKTIVKTI